MYPFNKGLGVIMPYEVVEENDEEIVMASFVVDPSVDDQLFRSALTF